MLEAAKQDARVIPALDRLYHQATSELELHARAQSCSRVAASLSYIGGPAAERELLLLMTEERVRLMNETGVNPAQLEQEAIRQDLRDLHAERMRRIHNEGSWTEDDEQQFDIKLVELDKQRVACVLWQSFERAMEHVESGPDGTE